MDRRTSRLIAIAGLVVILAVVIVVELAFVRWNEGRWPTADEP